MITKICRVRVSTRAIPPPTRLIAYQTALSQGALSGPSLWRRFCQEIFRGRNFVRKDALVEHMDDAARMNIEVVSPDVNASGVEFTVRDGEKFILGWLRSRVAGGGCRGSKFPAARAKEGLFRDMFDFCERIDAGALQSFYDRGTLIKAGAFDSLGAKRSQLLAVVDRALQSGAAALADRRSGPEKLIW